MHKKYIKWVIIVIINLALLLVLSEYACYQCAKKVDKGVKNHTTYIYNTFEESYEIITKERMRKPVGLNYNNKPILLLGCSFAYGYGLDEDDNFGTRLSKLTKRPVYNRAFEWLWGPQNMLYQARREDFYKEVPNPEYIVYVFIFDHFNRAYSKYYWLGLFYPYLHYNYKENELVREPDHWYNKFFITRIIGNYILKKTSIDKKSKLVIEHFRETKKELDKHWQNYKFIILIYDEFDYMKIKELDILKQEGFIVLSTRELIGRAMNNKEDKLKDNFHPSAYAWSVITPKFITKLYEMGYYNIIPQY